MKNAKHALGDKMIMKEQAIANLDIPYFYQTQIPSLRINGKPEALGLCPFHDDRHPSLSVNVETGLFNCFSCGEGGDVFKFYMKLHGVDFPTALRDIGGMTGMIETHTKPKVVATFEYNDAKGKPLYTKERLEPGRGGRSKEFRFRYRKDDQWVFGRSCEPVLYNLQQIVRSNYCLIVEGEGKADLLNSWGLIATCLDSGANSPWRDEYKKSLEGMDKVVIMPDKDAPGKQYAENIARALHDKVKVLKIVELPGLQDSEDIIDWAKIPGNDKTRLLESIKSTPQWVPAEIGQVEEVEDVDEVEVVREEIIPLYEFPIDIFSPELRGFINQVALTIDIGPEVVSSISMGILSACIGNSIKISPKQGFEIAPFIWTAAILPPGSGKSPLLDTLTKPIRRIQSEAYERYRQQIDNYKVTLRNFNKDENNREEPEEPTFEQYYTSDTTVEALVEVYEHQKRGILNIQDELSSLILGMNQYKGGGNDRQRYLELFNCSSWKVNRKSGARFISNTGAAIVGGIQPDIVPLVFGDDSFRDGLIFRFIFICPDERPMKFNRNCLQQGDCDYWVNAIRWCYDIPLVIGEDGFVKSRIIHLSEESICLWGSFYDEYGQLSTMMPPHVKGFIPKLILYSLKFMGVLHILREFQDKAILDVVDSKTTNDAIRLTKYYFGQVGKLLKLYDKRDTHKEYHTRIIHTIHNLQNEITNGKLALQKIVDTYNNLSPKAMHLTSEKLSRILRKEMGLCTQISTGGRAALLWEDQKLKMLFKRTSTTSTSSTIEEKYSNREAAKLENSLETTSTSSTSSITEEKYRVGGAVESAVLTEKSKEGCFETFSDNRISGPDIVVVDELEVLGDSVRSN